MPSTIGRIHDLPRLAPVFEIGRWSLRLAPPKPRRRGRSRLAQPNLRENRLIPVRCFDHAKIKNLLLSRDKYFVFAPITPVSTLRKSLHQIILNVRTRDIP